VPFETGGVAKQLNAGLGSGRGIRTSRTAQQGLIEPPTDGSGSGFNKQVYICMRLLPPKYPYMAITIEIIKPRLA